MLKSAAMSKASKLFITGACILWAVSFIATRAALISLPPLILVFSRLAVASACFMIWALFSSSLRRSLPLAFERRGLIVLLSLIGAALHYSIQTIGLKYTTAANASLYAVTTPITIAILGVVMLGERITRIQTIGIATACAGVLIVMGPSELGSVGFGASRAMGDLLVMASIIMWGFFTVLGKEATDRAGALALTAAVTWLGTLWMIPAAAFEYISSNVDLLSVSPFAWAAVAFLGAGCSFLATWLYFEALARSDSHSVGVYLYTIPPMTALLAWPILGERPGWNFIIGSAIVIAGVYMAEGKLKKKKSSATAARTTNGPKTGDKKNRTKNTSKDKTPLLVDGFNVLGVWRGLYHRRRFPKFPTPRMLVNLLEDLSTVSGENITVVFDGKGKGTRIEGDKVTVVYTQRGTEADDYLIWLARELSGKCTVVSSDKRVRRGCERAGATTIAAGRFFDSAREKIKSAKTG